MNRPSPSDKSLQHNRLHLYGGLALLILLVIATAAVSLSQLYRQAEARTHTSAQSLAKSLELTFAGMIDTIDVTLLSLADDMRPALPLAGKPDPRTVSHLLARHEKRLTHSILLRATDEEGYIRYGTALNPPYVNISDRSHFIHHVDHAEGGLFIAPPTFARIDKKWFWIFSRRLNKPDGAFGGIVYADFPIEEAVNIFRQLNLDPGSTVGFRDAELRLLMRFVAPDTPYWPSDDKGSLARLKATMAKNPYTGSYFNEAAPIDSMSRFYSYYINPKYGFLINVGVHQNVALAAWRRQAWIVGGMVFCFILASIAFTAAISRTWRHKEGVMAALEDSQQSLLEAQQIASLGQFNYDIRRDTWQSSTILDDIFGIGPDYPRNTQGWLDLVATDVRQPMADYFNRCVEYLLPFDREYPIVRHHDGQRRWVHGKGIWQRDTQSVPICLAGTIQDITDRKLSQQALVDSEARLNELARLSRTFAWEVNADGLFTYVSHVVRDVLGYAPEEIVGQFYFYDLHPEAGRDAFKKSAFDVSARQERFTDLVNPALAKDGRTVWLSTNGVPILDAEGALLGYRGSDMDISERKGHEMELQHIAYYDVLTGLPNRRLLSDRLKQAIAGADRHGGMLAVCYLDLDDLKPVNDCYGHAAGDRLLVGVAERLKEILRAEDTLARLGGDEFVMLFANLPHAEEVPAILDRVLAAIRIPFPIDGSSVSLSASIGVTLYPDDMADADTLLRHADQAMYVAKSAGKNCYRLFDQAHDQKIQERIIYLQRLQQALDDEEFVLHYQPKVDMLNGDIIGAEALLRWQHPDRGLLSPGAFLHHLDGSHLEIAVGEWVIESALRQMTAWDETGIGIGISVNIGAKHLLQPNFAGRLGQLLGRYPAIAARRLELEILETAAMSDMEQAAITLTQCRTLGVNLSLDDFGTGYSSLTYFRNLPIDILKIDQSFVRDMINDPADFGIVVSVVQLAKTFERAVIAEGVETLAHGEMLAHLGCRFMQGYGIARPMPASAMPDWIAQWRDRQIWLTLGNSFSGEFAGATADAPSRPV